MGAQRRLGIVDLDFVLPLHLKPAASAVRNVINENPHVIPIVTRGIIL